MGRTKIDSSSTDAAKAEDEKTDQECDDSDSEQGYSEWVRVERKTRHKVRHICRGGKNKTCGKAFKPKELAIECDACKGWFHPRCQELELEAYEAVSKYGLLWLCMDCKPMLLSMIEFGSKIEGRVAEAERKILNALSDAKPSKDIGKGLEEKIATMEKTVVGKMKEHQRVVSTTLEEQKNVFESVPKVTSELKKSAEQLKKVVETKDDRAGRELNVLVHNLPESMSDDPKKRKEYDEEIFKSMTNALVGESTDLEVKKIFRLGKKKETESQEDCEISKPRPRLMMITLNKKEHVNELMRKRWNLKDRGFPNIYLSRDLPPEEREEQKKLRKELAEKGKDSHRIFQGKVIPKRKEDSQGQSN